MPTPDKKTLPSTARSLPIALIRARENVMAPIRHMLAESGITEQQWRVLRVLSELGPMDASSLAEKSALLLPSLTRIAQAMKARGLITQRVNPEDRRRQTVAITDAGQQIIDTHTEQALIIGQSYRERLGDENFDTLIALLQQLEGK